MKDFLINFYNVALKAAIVYISGWLMFVKPIIGLIGCESVTGSMVAGVILKILFAVPVGTALYSIGVAIALKIFA